VSEGGADTPEPAGDCPIRLYHVSKSYTAGSFALHDVNLEVTRGEFVFLTGASGAGKTTLLEMLFAAEKPSEGSIIVLGRNVDRLGVRAIPRLRRRIGVVFQDFKLLANRTVEENVRLSLDVLGTPRREARSRVFRMLKQVGLAHKRYSKPLSLSGGEQQRVAIARALVNDPEILLADEPTGNLDPDLTIEIMDLLADASLRGTAVLVATHDLALVDRYGKRMIRLADGKIAEDHPARGSKS
jgi:cell division transport system ATP-binding protein